jgi:hypothetical protein
MHLHLRVVLEDRADEHFDVAPAQAPVTGPEWWAGDRLDA